MADVLTPLERRYVTVEQCIGDCNEKLRECHQIFGRHHTLDLFLPDAAFAEWMGIRLACVDEATRIEQQWQVRHG